MKKFERTGGLNAFLAAIDPNEAYKPRRWMRREMLAEMSSPDPPSNLLYCCIRHWPASNLMLTRLAQVRSTFTPHLSWPAHLR